MPDASRERARVLQDRICGASLPLPSKAKELRTEIFKCLWSASDERMLRSAPHQIQNLLKLTPSTDGQSHTHVITGGMIEEAKDFRRTRTAQELFERHDGALIGFSLTLKEVPPGGLALLAYDFEIRFPDENPAPRFLRFDLNPPAHGNADAGMRCHFHPGNDDLQAHAPLMAPVEILELFIYGLRPRNPDKPRA
jgi:hypothetical protein